MFGSRIIHADVSCVVNCTFRFDGLDQDDLANAFGGLLCRPERAVGVIYVSRNRMRSPPPPCDSNPSGTPVAEADAQLSQAAQERFDDAEATLRKLDPPAQDNDRRLPGIEAGPLP
jgi:hypothetical protein